MKTIILLVVLFFNIQFMYAQKVIINDSLKIELKKSKKVSKFYLHSATKLKSKELKKVLVRCDIEALHGQSTDINAFSVLDTVNKFRYRIAEYNGYNKGVSLSRSVYGYGRIYLKRQILNERGRPYPNLPKYNESVPDSFDNFSFIGYTNIEVPMYFSTNKNSKKNSIIYYSSSEKTKFRADLFFTIIINKKTPILELYYGNERIGSVEM